MSLRRLRWSKGRLTAEQKSAEGILGHDVGEASEALRIPKGGVMDRRFRSTRRRRTTFTCSMLMAENASWTSPARRGFKHLRDE